MQGMTKLLEEAIERIKALPAERQDAIAREILERAREATAAADEPVHGGDRELVAAFRALADLATPPPAGWKFRRDEGYEERLGRWE